MGSSRTAAATVLFTDVVDSTALRARLGEAAADRFFRSHEQQLRTVVVEASGTVVKSTGDGVMAVFDAASQAVAAAVALQQAVGAASPELAIRIGVAAGDVSWDGDNCSGLTVVTAARLEAAAAPGQILVSAVVRHLAGDRAGVHYEPLDPLVLKGLPSRVDAFSVAWERPGVVAPEWTFPATLPANRSRPLVGRQVELDLLGGLWKDACAGGRPIVLVGGEAGAGKTRLATELAVQAHDSGGIVLCGACDSELALPYQPWVTALEQLVAQLPAEVADGVRGDLAQVRALVPSVDQLVPGLERPEQLDPESARHRLITGVRNVVAAASAVAPVMLILDDLHWAGAQTLSMIRFIGRSAPIDRLMVVGTFRDSGDEITEPLAATLADLRRLDTVTRLRLCGLEPAAVEELLAAAGWDGDANRRESAVAIAERSGGNPFLVTELCLNADAAGAVPDSVVEVVAARLSRLPADARRLADIVAISSGRVELPVVRALHGETTDLSATLARLIATGLVDELPNVVPSYRFRHDLFRQAVVELLPGVLRAELHLSLAQALEETHGGEDQGRALADLTRHYAAAVPLVGRDKAVRYGRQAAAEARRTAAYDEAASLLELVLEVVPEACSDRAALLVDLVDARHRSGRHLEAIRIAAEAYKAATLVGDLRLRALAALGLEQVALVVNASVGEALTMLSAVLEGPGGLESSLYWQVKAARGRAMVMAGHPDAADVVREALTGARTCGGKALGVALLAAMTADPAPAELVAISREAARLAELIRDDWEAMAADGHGVRGLIALGDLHGAFALSRRHSETARASRFQVYRFQSQVLRANLLLAAGRFADAEAEIDAAESFDTEDDNTSGSGVYGLFMFLVRREQGRLEEIRPVLGALNARAAGGVWGPGLAAAYAQLGMLEDAQLVFDKLAADGFSGIPRDGLWRVSLAFLAETCVALEDEARAVPLLDELDAYAGQALMAGLTACAGPADTLRAALAEVAARPRDADAFLAAALAFARRARSPVWEARVEQTWSWVLARRGDHVGSRTHHKRARAIAEPIGMGSIPAEPRW